MRDKRDRKVSGAIVGRLIERRAQRFLGLGTEQAEEEPFRGIGDHLPQVSSGVDRACRTYAKTLMKSRTKKARLDANIRFTNRLIDLEIDPDGSEAIWERASLYGAHLLSVTAETDAREARKRTEDVPSQATKEVDEACYSEFKRAAADLRKLQRGHANDAWLAYFEPRGGKELWRVAQAPLGGEKHQRLAHRVLGVWRRHFGQMRPSQNLVNRLSVCSEAEFRDWLPSQLSQETLTLSRQILPRGRWHRVSRAEAAEWYANEKSEVDWERFNFLESLRPIDRYKGQHLSSQKYTVFEFEEIVVAESNLEGNALYYVLKEKGDWERILTLTKREALRNGAKRIIHRTDGTWKRQLRKLVESGRGE